MTINQLTELIRHIEEEHNFFNHCAGQRIVKSIIPCIETRRAGRVVSVDLQGYGWEKVFATKKDNHKTPNSMFNEIMAFLDTHEEEPQTEPF
jgi:hypothetical protein